MCGPSALWSRAPEGEDSLAVPLFDLEEGLQRRRLRLHLLERCPQPRAVGYRDAIISTGLWESGAMDSPRGYPLYTNHGFSVYDWAHGLKKTLTVRR